jgi:hypothetical protein
MWRIVCVAVAVIVAVDVAVDVLWLLVVVFGVGVVDTAGPCSNQHAIRCVVWVVVCSLGVNTTTSVGRCTFGLR